MKLKCSLLYKENAVLIAQFCPDADVDEGELVDVSYWTFDVISTDHPPWKSLDRISGRYAETTLHEALFEISPELEITPSDEDSADSFNG